MSVQRQYQKNMKMYHFSFINIKLLLLLTVFSISNLVYSQTATIANGNYNAAANWDNGVPGLNDEATVTNDMTMNVDITLGKDGTVIVDGGTLDGSATTNDFEITSTGYLEVGGSVIIGGNFTVSNFGDFYIKACDTLRIEGNVIIENNSVFTIDSCAVFYVEGDLILRNNNSADVDGQIYVEGDLTVQNNAIIFGTGNIQVDGVADIKNSGSIFGNTTPCTIAPCEYGSGVGLPIELKAFAASYIQHHAIEVNWSSISEINNDYYMLYYSFNGIQFNHTEKINGAGNSNSELSYSYNLQNIPSDLVYLKLRQTDFDGKFEEFGPIVVKRNASFGTDLSSNFSIYPNPGNGINLSLSATNAGNYIGSNIAIINASGKILVSKTLNESDLVSDQLMQPFNGLSLNAGVYLIRLINKDQVLTKTYLVQ